MIIQAISLSDQLDKDLNTFFMRVREWYGWHFPELYKLVPDAHQYALLAVLIGDRTSLTEDSLEEMQEILDDDETRAKNVLDAARASMVDETVFGSVTLGLESSEKGLFGAEDLDSRSGVLGQVGEGTAKLSSANH